MEEVRRIKFRRPKRIINVGTSKFYEFEGNLHIRPMQRGISLTSPGGEEIDFDTWLERAGFEINTDVPVRIVIERV